MPRRAKTGLRCWWCGDDPVYVAYHDREWGVPVTDDRALYEKLVLDGFQAGLSWITILRKRPAFRRAFDRLHPTIVARYGARDIERLLRDEGIVRSRAKIEGAIANARAWERVMHAGGRGAFRDLLWQHVDHCTIVNRPRVRADVRPSSNESERLAKTLRKAGFKFCGPVICHAFMQAVGMVNDHLVACPRHAACEALARRR